MARPIEYDKQEVLDNITKAFWLKGFEGTSVSELVSETQLNTRTMYNLFGDKTGLFHAALENYHDSVLNKLMDKLKSCRGFTCLLGFIESLQQIPFLNGCLFANTLCERNNVNRNSLEYVQEFYDHFEQEVKAHLDHASQHENFKGNSSATASLITCFLHGYSNFVKMNRTPESKQQMLGQFVSLLKAS